MNGLLWFVAPIALVLSGLLAVVALFAAIRMNWGRPRV